jgi:hypothetical protein
MAWTTIPNADIDQDSPITQTLMTALRDNPIAIANGDAGAPRIQAIAAMSHQGAAGAVGTYVFARRGDGGGDITFGGGIGGASLVPTSATTSITVSGTGDTATLIAGSALAGTWRAMGTYDHTVTSGGSQISMGGATLWLRIS